jgi:hypothetical protein
MVVWIDWHHVRVGHVFFLEWRLLHDFINKTFMVRQQGKSAMHKRLQITRLNSQQWKTRNGEHKVAIPPKDSEPH